MNIVYNDPYACLHVIIQQYDDTRYERPVPGGQAEDDYNGVLDGIQELYGEPEEEEPEYGDPVCFESMPL